MGIRSYFPYHPPMRLRVEVLIGLEVLGEFRVQAFVFVSGVFGTSV